MTEGQEGRLNKAHGSQGLILTAIGVGTLVAFVLLVILAIGKLHAGPQRSESYKNASGAAGLSAIIDYTCAGPCKQKYDFNVYIFKESGQQVAVVRPDSKGQINAALPEGDYLLLISKQFGKDKLFPQEHLSLKNGKQLELKLGYEEGTL